MHHQPFWWIECNWISFFNAFQPNTIFGTNKCAASISSINMQPNLVLITNITDLSIRNGNKIQFCWNKKSWNFCQIIYLFQFIKCTSASCSKCSTNLKSSTTSHQKIIAIRIKQMNLLFCENLIYYSYCSWLEWREEVKADRMLKR